MGKIKLFQNRSLLVLNFVKIWDKKHFAPHFFIATSFFSVVYSVVCYMTGSFSRKRPIWKIDLIYYFFMTFSLCGNLRKLLHTCCWHIQFPGKEENKGENYARQIKGSKETKDVFKSTGVISREKPFCCLCCHFLGFVIRGLFLYLYK